eukprot:gene25247-biopygen13507
MKKLRRRKRRVHRKCENPGNLGNPAARAASPARSPLGPEVQRTAPHHSWRFDVVREKTIPCIIPTIIPSIIPTIIPPKYHRYRAPGGNMWIGTRAILCRMDQLTSNPRRVCPRLRAAPTFKAQRPNARESGQCGRAGHTLNDRDVGGGHNHCVGFFAPSFTGGEGYVSRRRRQQRGLLLEVPEVARRMHQKAAKPRQGRQKKKL